MKHPFRTIGILVILFAIAGLGIFYAPSADALPLPICINIVSCGFGGVIEKVEGCSCIPLSKVGAPIDLWPANYGELIDITPPKGGSVMIIKGWVAQLIQLGFDVETTIYDYEKIEPDYWVLGLTDRLPLPIPCYELDEVATAIKTGISCALGDCTPKITCTDSKGEGWPADKIGTSGAPAPANVINNLKRLTNPGGSVP